MANLRIRLCASSQSPFDNGDLLPKADFESGGSLLASTCAWGRPRTGFPTESPDFPSFLSSVNAQHSAQPTWVLYRLPDVTKAAAGDTMIFICEGEKDADNIAALGFVSTTCAMGAGKWRAEYNESLRGADVVLLPHNDEPGRDHAEHVAAELRGVAKRVRLLDIAEHWPSGAGQDISDWLAAGGTADKLNALVDALPDWQPSGDNKPSVVPLTAIEFLSLEIPRREIIMSPWLREKGTVMVY